MQTCAWASELITVTVAKLCGRAVIQPGCDAKMRAKTGRTIAAVHSSAGATCDCWSKQAMQLSLPSTSLKWYPKQNHPKQCAGNGDKMCCSSLAASEAKGSLSDMKGKQNWSERQPPEGAQPRAKPANSIGNEICDRMHTATDNGNDWATHKLATLLDLQNVFKIK